MKAILLECKVCRRIKKFGEWIVVTLEGRRALEPYVDFKKHLCDLCTDPAVSSSS